MTRPSGLDGSRCLVLAFGAVDIDRLRRLGHVEIVVARRRDDGSYDEDIAGGFDAATTDAGPDDVEAVRQAVRFAGSRLRGDRVIELTSPTPDPAATARSLAAALPGTKVWVAALMGRAGTVVKVRLLAADPTS